MYEKQTFSFKHPALYVAECELLHGNTKIVLLSILLNWNLVLEERHATQDVIKTWDEIHHALMEHSDCCNHPNHVGKKRNEISEPLMLEVTNDLLWMYNRFLVCRCI